RQYDRNGRYAFDIPAKQADPGSTRRLIDTLAAGMVEVEVEADGSHTIRMSQPYSGYAKALLERQRYPDLRQYPGGPPQRPYDVTAHTLPLLMGVDVEPLDEHAADSLKREGFQLSGDALAMVAVKPAAIFPAADPHPRLAIE